MTSHTEDIVSNGSSSVIVVAAAARIVAEWHSEPLMQKFSLLFLFLFTFIHCATEFHSSNADGIVFKRQWDYPFFQPGSTVVVLPIEPEFTLTHSHTS